MVDIDIIKSKALHISSNIDRLMGKKQVSLEEF